jgi:hypothetical protein
VLKRYRVNWHGTIAEMWLDDEHAQRLGAELIDDEPAPAVEAAPQVKARTVVRNKARDADTR